MRVCARHWQRAAPQICKSMFQNQRGTRQWRVSVGHDNIAHVRFIIFLFVRAVHFSDAVSNILVTVVAQRDTSSDGSTSAQRPPRRRLRPQRTPYAGQPRAAPGGVACRPLPPLLNAPPPRGYRPRWGRWWELRPGLNLNQRLSALPGCLGISCG